MESVISQLIKIGQSARKEDMSKTKRPDMNYKLNLPVGVYRARFDGCFGTDDLTQLKYMFHMLDEGFSNRNIEIIFPYPNSRMKNKDRVLRLFYMLQCRLAGRQLEFEELGPSFSFVGCIYKFRIGAEGLSIAKLEREEVAHD